MYKYLFWDGIYRFNKIHYQYKDGFVVEKNKLINFLETSLSKIGLNTFEINDFIVYWLPRLNENEFNLIHFWINDNYDNSAILEVNPKPETLIRVYMEFKKVSPNYKIKEQILPVIKRKGFTFIEWGGSEIENDIL